MSTVTSQDLIAPHKMRGFKTLDEQVKDLREMAANPRQRIATGLKSLDLLALGPAAGEVFTVVGRSHTGKSMFATNVLLHNPTVPMIFFSLEMPAHQVLQRLYAHVTDQSGRDVVRKTMRNDLDQTLDWIAKDFEEHIVVDASGLTLGDMAVYCENYGAYFGHRPSAVVIDYLEEIGGAKASGEGWMRTEATASALKGWAKDQKMAVFSLHQANQKTEQWEPPNGGSAKGGGFVESDVVVGMWRPGWDPDLGEVESYAIEPHMYLNVIKNRITGRMTRPERPLKFKLADSGKMVDLEYDANLRFYGEW